MNIILHTVKGIRSPENSSNRFTLLLQPQINLLIRCEWQRIISNKAEVRVGFRAVGNQRQ